MENKNKVECLRMGLALVGIKADANTAYLLSKFLEKYNEKGGRFSVDDATDIRIEFEKHINGEKPKMTLEDLRGVAINCKTRKESDEVLRLFDELGIEWGSTSPCSECHLNIWNRFKSKTCYIPFGYCGFGYERVAYFETEGRDVKSAQWFLGNFSKESEAHK